MTDAPTMVAAIVLFPNVTLLDAVGPYEALWRVPGLRTHMVGPDLEPIVGGGGALLQPTATFQDLPTPDVLLVPGGPGTNAAQSDPVLLEYLRSAAAGVTWLASVCSGSLVLGAAGLIDGRRASTYWLSRDDLGAMGVDVSSERVTVDGNLITAAGVSAGIDLGLRLAALLSDDHTGAAIQLAMEYAPEPPFDIGPNDAAPADLVARYQELRAGWFTPPTTEEKIP